MDINSILHIIAENTLRTGLPLPAPRDIAYHWAKPLNLPRSGSMFLYTGVMYQLMPYIKSFVAILERFEDSRLAKALRLAASPKLTGLARAAIKPERDEIELAESILTSIARLLARAGINYAYLYEDDMYTGVILYDMGLEEAFQEHAARVYERLRRRGAKKLITVDPHTTYMLRHVYPKYVDGFDIEVVNYLELLDEALAGRAQPAPRLWSGERVVVHDPCLYARALKLVKQPRRLLEHAGLTVLEPRRSGRMTYCCGGPIEALSPRLAGRIASTRLRELREKAPVIVTMCPICFVSFSRVAKNETIVDISIILSKTLRQDEEA
ncbi:MAG TPA: (Fe-S)-binding protein [Pyrodictium delaneyi]|uniref:(Fe-S)-binding protein n=1 Tax=Pyrodictium delaneyi TaxID=1273541 RepID=A0A832ZSD7_9CREN|nr:(Fe-S)-binding protein [Pyrodictium delaneyi]